MFNFTTGQEDVARVTKEAFLTCNSTNPISHKATGPANFTLDSLGGYYFIGTLDKHCILGQRLAINVTAYPGSTPAPAPRGPRNYTVGDGVGWLIPPGGPIFYASWAYNKTFFVGDTLGTIRSVDFIDTIYQTLGGHSVKRLPKSCRQIKPIVEFQLILQFSISSMDPTTLRW